MREDAVEAAIEQYVPHQTAPADWDLDPVVDALQRDFTTSIDAKAWVAAEPEMDESTFRTRAVAAVEAQYQDKVARIGEPLMRQIEREVVLRNLDQHWREHLAAMDYLRQGIHLRGYAQKDYRYEFKREAFGLFSSMLDRVKHDSASVLCRVEVRDEAEVEREQAEQREKLMRALQAQHAEAQSVLLPPEPVPDEQGLPPIPGSAADAVAPFVRNEPKVGRNEPCPCGSGKKFKQCHGSLSA
jgi:preprotein translocase subunit SecA